MNSSSFLKSIDQNAAESNTIALKQYEQQQMQQNFQAVIRSINEATKAIIAFQSKHQPTTQVEFPDVDKIIGALDQLKQPLQENKPDDSRVIDAINKLGETITGLSESTKAVEEVTVKNQPDYTPAFDNLAKSIENLDVKPVINIPEEKPDDYSPIVDALSSVVEAVQAIEIPEAPQLDLSPLMEATAGVQAAIQALRFPVPNYVLPFQTPSGEATQAITFEPTVGSLVGTVYTETDGTHTQTIDFTDLSHITFTWS